MASSPEQAERVDVLIGGAGFAGLALAIALRQGLGPAFAVTVADPALGRAGSDVRASAIVAAARRLLETHRGLEQGRAATPSRSSTWRSPTAVCRTRFGRSSSPSRARSSPGEPFAHMIENGPLVDALVEKAKETGVVLRSSAVTDFSRVGDDRHPDPPLSGGGSIRGSGRHGSSTSGSRMAMGLRRACWWPRMARARRSASAPASPATAGPIRNRASWPLSCMSAIMTAAPRSISCPRVRSRSCR